MRRGAVAAWADCAKTSIIRQQGGLRQGAPVAVFATQALPGHEVRATQGVAGLAALA